MLNAEIAYLRCEDTCAKELRNDGNRWGKTHARSRLVTVIFLSPPERFWIAPTGIISKSNRIALQDSRQLTNLMCTGTRPAARANAAAKAVVKGSSVRLSISLPMTECNGSSQIAFTQKY